MAQIGRFLAFFTRRASRKASAGIVARPEKSNGTATAPVAVNSEIVSFELLTAYKFPLESKVILNRII